MQQQQQQRSSFLYTILRDPQRRAVSQYFFRMSREQSNYSDKTFKKFLEGACSKNLCEGGWKTTPPIHYYLKRHTTNTTSRKKLEYSIDVMSSKSSKSKSLSPALLTFNEYKDIANEIMLEYDFMAITERFDESMVVLSILLGEDVTLGDMLYMSSKPAGGYDCGNFKGRCNFIQKSYITEEMKNYFNDGNDNGNGSDSDSGSGSDDKQEGSQSHAYTWEERSRWDRALYEAANRSLDRTIDEVIGRTQFEQKLKRYKEALQKVNEKCAAIAKWPCTKDGRKRPKSEQNCLYIDFACGYECVDDVAKEMNI